jgi:metal transporter CNNM
MGQDEIYLQVIASSGEGRERKNAAKVLRLLKRGKHWVLVTLLLSNVITNETLPIVLDRSLGGGWPAVVSSTVLIGTFSMLHCAPPTLVQAPWQQHIQRSLLNSH